MKRLTRDEVQIERLLRASRAVAVLGAGARRGQRGNAVVEYLKREGFDVFPVRPDRAEVAGLASWPRLADVPGSVDIVLLVGGVNLGGRRKDRVAAPEPGYTARGGGGRRGGGGNRAVLDEKKMVGRTRRR